MEYGRDRKEDREKERGRERYYEVGKWRGLCFGEGGLGGEEESGDNI